MAAILQGRRTSSTTSTAVVYEVIPPPGKPVIIKSIKVTLADATATILSFGLPGAIGVTPTTPQAFVNTNGGGAALTTSARAWATPPTQPNAIGQFNLQAIGAHQTIYFGDGFLVPVGNTFVIYSNSTTGLLDLQVAAVE